MKTRCSCAVFVILCSIIRMAYGQALREAAEQTVRNYVADNTNGIKEDPKRNIFINKKTNTIHLFMLSDGGLLLKGYPTTATDKNFFELHVLTEESDTSSYSFEADGEYKPIFTIDTAFGKLTKADKKKIYIKIKWLDFPLVGPYTTQVVFTVKRNGMTPPLATHTISIANSIHASIGSGFVYSTLKNPTNIRAVPLVNSSKDSTLIADNATGKVTLTLMATLYPWGRNSLLMPSWRFRDRAGIVVGTTIASSTKNFQNLYLGLQYDFAIGGSVVAGADIASRQRILGIDYHDFTFGESRFTGKLPNKLYTSVGVGFFFGVQVDSRILAKLFAAAP
ncbi:hypothetical protein A0257_05435 [Hymenobacter psoromatis]|nr:hypothetical protein A0257_05435 [Hymenobacter psoromatis]